MKMCKFDTMSSYVRGQTAFTVNMQRNNLNQRVKSINVKFLCFKNAYDISPINLELGRQVLPVDRLRASKTPISLCKRGHLTHDNCNQPCVLFTAIVFL